jgi:predicted dehydrogenase
MSENKTRREFLKISSAGVLATAAVQSSTRAASDANSQIVVGLIGCGGRGSHDAELFKNTPNVELAYVADVDATRRASVAKSLGVASDRALDDMRRLLDQKSVDAVIVATPDHWHSPAAILACDAGKHVYVEKPISHNVREGRLLVNASQRNRTHVQHGTQSRSTGMMIQAVQMLREGIIGDVLSAKCWNVQRRGTIGRGQDTDPPAGFDYDNWVGPAPMIPYRTNRVHNRWSWWYHFGTGDMGNDGVHDIDYTRWGLGVDIHPSKIVALGGKYFFDDEQWLLIRGGKKHPFTFKTIGQLASIGRRTGVANILGVNFSGFVAWWLWRTIYLSKLPRLEKKVRVALDWLLDVVFSKDLVQFRTQRAPTMSRAETEPRSPATAGSRG